MKGRTRCWHLVQLLGLVILRCSEAAVHSSSLKVRMGPAPNHSNAEATRQAIEKRTLRLGAAVTLTDGLGSKTALGREIRQGYEFFVSWYNNELGGVKIAGVPHIIDLQLIDDVGDPKKAASIASYFIRNRGITLLLGPGGDKITNAVAQVVNDTDSVLIASSAVEHHVFHTRPGVFGTFRPPNRTFETVVETLKSNPHANIQSISYIVEDSHFEKMFCKSIPVLASKFSLELKHEVDLGAGAKANFTSALADMVRNPPDVLVGCVSENLCKRLLRTVAQLKVEPQALILLDCVTGLDPNKEIGNRALYVLGVSEWAPRLPLEDQNGTWTAMSITGQYAQRFGRQRPSLELMSSLAAAEILLKAIEFSGSQHPKAVRAELQTIDYRSAYGRVKFDELGRNIGSAHVLQTGPWNFTRLVLPENYSQAGIIFPLPTWEERPCLQTRTSSAYGYNAQQKCNRCPPSYKSEVVNGTVPANNSFGMARSEVFRICEECPPIHAVVPSLWEEQCVPCPSGHLVSAEGFECVACAPGKYRAPGGIDPDTGLPYQPGDSCTPCPPGHMQPKAGQEVCVQCGLGTAAQNFGTSQCERCPPIANQGVISPLIKRKRNFTHFCRWSSSATRYTSACMVCNDGPQGKKDATMCCDYNMARIEEKLSRDFAFEVRVCVMGDPSHVPDQFCEDAPRPEKCGQYTPPPPSGDPDEAFGTYYADTLGQLECNKCPTGGTCTASCPNQDGNCTAHEVVRVKYISAPDHFLMRNPPSLAINPLHGLGPFECRTKGACLGGDPENLEKVNRCHENHEGLLCNVCKPGYTRRFPELELCEKCPSYEDSLNFCILGVACVGGHILLLGFLAQRGGRRPRSLQSIVMSIFSNHCQIIAIAYSFCKPGLTGIVGDYLSYYYQSADAVAQDPSRAVMLLDCFFHYNGMGSITEFAEQKGGGFPGRYGITLGAIIIIPAMVVFVVVAYTIWFLLPRIRLTAKTESPLQRAKMLKLRYYGPWVLVTCIVLHPIATKFMLLPFDCAEQNAGTSRTYDVPRFVPHMDIECGSAEHTQIQFLGGIGVLVWSFGLPLLFYLILLPIRKKRRLREPWCFESLGFLYNGFEPDYYYWQSVNMLRKVFFCICAAVPGYTDSGRATLMLFVAMCMFVLSNAFRPYDNRAYDILDDLERISIRSMIYMLLARLTQVVTDGSYRFNEPSSREIRDIILLAMVLLMQIHVVSLTFWGLFREWLKPLLESCALIEAPEKITLSNKSEKPREKKIPETAKGLTYANFPMDEFTIKGYWMPNGGGCVVDAQGQTAGGMFARMKAVEKKAAKKAKKLSHKKTEQEELSPEPEEKEVEVKDGVGDKDEELLQEIYKETVQLVLRNTHKVDLHDVRLVLRAAFSMAVANSGHLGKKADLVDEDGVPLRPLLAPVTTEQVHVGLTQMILKLSGEDWQVLQRFDAEAEEVSLTDDPSPVAAQVPRTKKEEEEEEEGGGLCGCLGGKKAKPPPKDPAASADPFKLNVKDEEYSAPLVEMESPARIQPSPPPSELDPPVPPPLEPPPEGPPRPPLMIGEQPGAEPGTDQPLTSHMTEVADENVQIALGEEMTAPALPGSIDIADEQVAERAPSKPKAAKKRRFGNADELEIERSDVHG